MAMTDGNGNGNGKDGNGNGTPVQSSGGEGGLQLMEQSGGRVRRSLQIIQRAAENGWLIKDEWLEALPKVAVQIAATGNPREKLRALEVLRAMMRDRVDAAVMLDKIERLDAGEATERTELGPILLDGGREF